jgi:hypothetical protein
VFQHILHALFAPRKDAPGAEVFAITVYDGEAEEDDDRPLSNIANIDALAAGTQLLSLQLPRCPHLASLAPLMAMDLQTLFISGCSAVSDLAPLTALVNLQTLDMRNCDVACDLAPVEGMTNLKHLYTGPIDSEGDDE